MTRALMLRFLLILAVLCGSAWYLHHDGLTLGLDLQGGMHLVLEIADPEATMTPEARTDAADQAVRVIRARIDELGVEEPSIQRVGGERIIVELPGIADEGRAKDVIRRAAFLEFRLVRDDGLLRGALRRLDQATPTSPFSGLLLETGRPGEFAVAERDVPLLREYLGEPEVRRALPRDVRLALGDRPIAAGAEPLRSVYVVEDRPFLTGESLVNAVPGRDPEYGLTVVSFDLDSRGARTFDRVTGENIGGRMAILLDGDVVSAPFIRTRIGARGRIEMGHAPMTEALDLALVLRAGALPAALEILEERTVGPSLGADAIERGARAGLAAVLLVIVILVAYYRVAGLLAVAALAAYGLMVLGALAAVGATLTVPGIAGLVLSVGMAVDANVLIFERIREELGAGRPPRLAVDHGFRHSMSAIVDANLTTLVVALILFQFGVGPVRGFAVTLSIGIVASFFTAVYVTRSLFLAYVARKRAADSVRV